ncbi:Aste57867_3066 [Aphanomyces stellatus]|uniref:Aste57867_3066 protein n=1 Tax=Aphanomyces stellatus TaxID=120398 RepID=A0A485K8Z7_9STRA|nr:hypothetical protein As57867_003057 [Aphanomyces stellatus]VFT80246.1 Aste57867_3066 [Aphanomyces stellatus]
MLFHATTPDFQWLRHESHLDVTDKYMVVSTRWRDKPVYFHNVYAPVHNTDRESFFASLPRTFPPVAHHIIFGDFNVTMDREIDLLVPTSNHHRGRLECMDWLQALGVVDAWRIHHPFERVYSSPKGKNRLDYIFLDVPLMESTYHDANYSRSTGIAEHLFHTVTLQPTHVPCGHGYWKLPKELLVIPEVATTILSEARSLLCQIQRSSNTGVVWEGWKKSTRQFLKSYHIYHMQSRKEALASSERAWRNAVLQAEQGRISIDALTTARVQYETSVAAWKSFENVRNFDFHAPKMK